ncbi:MAG: glycoside hydrolase family 3 protein [Acutalibacteraceae bacterium]
MISKLIGKIVNKLSQNEAFADTDKMDKTVTEGMPELLRKAGSEGAVLLKNDGVLPFSLNDKISVFGRCQIDYMYVGYGSGGDVIKPYTVSLIDGLLNAKANINSELYEIYKTWVDKHPVDHGFWGHWPYNYPEMPINEGIIRESAEKSDSAVIIISRSAGEDRENSLAEGSYYLTKDEKFLLEKVTTYFNKTVIILNIGNIIDFSFFETLKGDYALLLAWQGGMESGNALADILFGAAEPSGRLPVTVAKSYDDYPSSQNFGNKEFNNYAEDIFVGYRYFETFEKDKVLYPFGFGLGYSTFTREFSGAEITNNAVSLKVKTTNISDFSGKDVIQVYVEAPSGALGKPKRVLCEYEKSRKLNKDETEEFVFNIPFYTFSSYDDSGVTGHISSYVLEKGEYKFYIGGDVRSAEFVYSFNLDETLVSETLDEISKPTHPFKRMVEKNGSASFESVPLSSKNLKEIIKENLRYNGSFTGNRGITLEDVKSNKFTVDEFVSQLTPDELEAISRGDYTMNSKLGNEGNAGAFGGVLPSLREKGIKPVITTDGPSGIRIKQCCSLLPVGSLFSSMWNKKLTCEVYKKVGSEMKVKGSDILLGPGMNIQRNVLCGRNFEYYSEDPFLSGKTAAEVVKGIQSEGVGACPKHFACNNQETNRNENDSRLSERALREIYLKGFEICVKEANPVTIMTSYNKINGVWAHYNYDLVTRVLKGEWNYKGTVITDWWMQPSVSPEFPNLKDQAYRVRAGVDVLMPGAKRGAKKKPDGTLLKTFGDIDGITLTEMQAVAKRIAELELKIKY